MKKYLYMYRKLQAFLTTNYNNSLMDDSLSLSSLASSILVLATYTHYIRKIS